MENCDIRWMWTLLGECPSTPYEVARVSIGVASIVLWLFAQCPQVIKNYRRKKTESLSFPFMIIWLLGDVTNLAGCFLTNQLPFQRVLATYFLIVDSILLLQMIFYRRSQAAPNDDETVSLLHDAQKDQDCGHVSGGKSLVKDTLFISVTVLSLLSQTLAVEAVSPSDGNEVNFETVKFPIGSIVAWTCVACYVSSRIPQIIKNYRGKAVDDLSIWLFVFAALGNLTYATSILMKSQEASFLLNSLPYLIGSAGTVIFDLIIFMQWAYYSRRSQSK